VRSSIWKSPVQGRIHVSTLNLDGDQQSDLSVHGGVVKAVYVYPSEHYSYWRTQLPGVDLPWGAFGENLSTEGVLENDVQIGDRICIRSAEFMVTQPRMPCFKLGIRFDRRDMVKRFLQSKRTGFYLAVIREGEVENGDAIELIHRVESGVTIADIVNLYSADSQKPRPSPPCERATRPAARLERLFSETSLGCRCLTPECKSGIYNPLNAALRPPMSDVRLQTSDFCCRFERAPRSRLLLHTHFCC
jgi:MOSC domain-containing protein YiiM